MTDELVEQARIKRTAPRVTREKGQRSTTNFEAPFLLRFFPQWSQPDWLGAERWRQIVQAQSIAVDCREAIINYTLSLDWKIVPRDTNKYDELKGLITYYENFLKYTGEYLFETIIEWVLKDFLDLPFGSGVEIGRQGDKPTGRVRWIKLLDGGTLFPTMSTQYPVGQVVPSQVQQPVYFPAHAINRIYMSPRTEITRAGWGMAPPEKIYLAMEMLGRGDKYYGNLLLDTPEAGLLDLMTMSKESAENWIAAFRQYMGGIDPFKIPVLYEHDQAAKWIPFGRPPTELMFDRVTLRYAALLCAGYGLTLSDIGFASTTSGGDTLAGSIRQERRSRRSGYSKAKTYLAAFFNRLIDPTQRLIKFEWIDLDDELAIAKARARLANATAMGQMIDKGVISPEEARMQTIADGTFTISMSETLPKTLQQPVDATPERTGMLGKPVSPSQGGHGEVLPRSNFDERIDAFLNVPDIELKRLANAVISKVDLGVSKAANQLSVPEMDIWSDWQYQVIWGDIVDDIPEFTLTTLSGARSTLDVAMKTVTWWQLFDRPGMLVDEIVEMLSEIHKERIYISGELSYLSDYKLSPKLEQSWRKFLSERFDSYNILLKSWVQNAVIAGITSYLVQQIDKTLKIDDNLIGNIKAQLKLCAVKIVEQFEKDLMEMENA